VFADESNSIVAVENLSGGVEDTKVITENGCENLNAIILREVEEIEALMKTPGIIQIL